MKKQIWRMKDLCVVSSKVDFGKEVTIEQAIEMWMNEDEYSDVLEFDIVEVNECIGAE